MKCTINIRLSAFGLMLFYFLLHNIYSSSNQQNKIELSICQFQNQDSNYNVLKEIDTIYRNLKIDMVFSASNYVKIFYGNNLSIKVKLPEKSIRTIRKNIDHYIIKVVKTRYQYYYYLIDTLLNREYIVLDKSDLPEDDKTKLLRLLNDYDALQTECRGNFALIDSCIELEFFDFDSDGTNELIVMGWNPCFFVHHGYFLIICKKISGSWTIIFEDEGVEFYSILTTKNNGYYSFYAGGVSGRGENPEVVKIYYRFNGKRYSEYKTTIEDF